VSMELLSGLMAVVALWLSYAVGANAWVVGKTLGLLDFPDGEGGRKRHKHVTPLVGGVAVVLAAVIAAVCVAESAATPTIAWHFAWLAISVTAMFMVGAIDDRFHLAPSVRLAVTVVILLLTVESAPDFAIAFLRFDGFESLLLMGSLGIAFSLLCLAGLLNAINMADGKNGIVAGMGMIWTLVLATHAPAEARPVLAAVGATLLVIWCYNMRGRLFLGDGGSYAISTLFGLLAIYVYNHAFDRMPAGDVAVMFAVPVFDTLRLVLARIWQGRSPFEGGRDHFHHYIHDRIGWPRGLWVYLGVVALPNFGSFVWPGASLAWLAVALMLYLVTLAAMRVPATTVA
jgi:UDP-GlcNAc:undecaprenyl-phosphate/decaprenyl-phosphate GlcNAc-1-phosphate transferase